ncbi:pantetheine-phosphate adenylyltransferase [Olsenella profusa]|uniref:pantetheine-phosphate adenylyltransferase n=1 Tax=Olsenella profusa TaxID=138595 RepID=UPI00315B23D1
MSADTITHVVVPGTFDPVTLGHIDVIRRTRRLFPRVTVAVAASANKNGRGTTFTLDERVEMIREALALEGLPDDIDVQPFTGLLVSFCSQIGAGGVVKGLRAMTDFEYELQQADLNSHLSPEIESVFVMSSPEYGYVSSSIVREIASMGSDVSILVTANVAERLREHYRS